jgi:hypothetical protein
MTTGGVILDTSATAPGFAAGPSEAQYRVKTRFPWVPQQGSAAGKTFSGQNRGAHFNPKELTVDQKAHWQKGAAL